MSISGNELREIDPAAIEALLQRMKWYQHGGVNGVSRQWIFEDQGRAFSAVVPLDRAFDDYPTRVWECLHAISRTFDGSFDSLILELRSPGLDELTNAKDTPVLHGAVAWKAAENQIVGFRQAMTAAAKATEEKQQHFGRAHQKFASEFVSQLRMGQTRVGSFIVTALAPSGTLPIVDQGSVYPNNLGPTGRMVTETLARGMMTLRLASQDYLDNGVPEVFRDTVADGVSLELVNAVKKNLGDAVAVETTFTWNVAVASSSTPGVVGIQFDAKHSQALKAASRWFREYRQSRKVNIVGLVTGLERPEPGLPGVISVRVISGSDADTVKVVLENDYNDAVDYHKSGLIIKLTGIQDRDMSQYWIRDVSSITLIDSSGNAQPFDGMAP